MATFATDDVLAEITRQAPNFGVNPNLVMPLFMAENSGSGNAKSGDGAATSTKGASGILQVMPSTARGLQAAGLLPTSWTHDPDNLQSQVSAGLAAVSDMLSRAKNPNDPLELAATYNGGNTGKSNYLAGKPLAPETSDYLRKYKSAANNLGIKMPDSTNFAETPGIGNIGVTPSSSTPATGATTTRTSVRRSVTDPGVMDTFTSAINDAISPGGTLDQAADSVIAGGQTRFNALASLSTAITDKAKADAQEAAVQSTMDATEAVKKANILVRLNLDPAYTDNEAMRAANIVNDTDSQLVSMKSEIDQKMAVGMFDNPLEWLVNQMRLPGMVAKYNGIVGVQNAATDHYKTLVGIRDTEMKVATGMDADLIGQKTVARQASIAAKAQEDLQRVQVDASGAAAREGLTLAQLAGTKAQLAGLDVQRTKEIETTSTGNNAKAEADAALQRDLDNVNRIFVAAGSTPIGSLAAFKLLQPAERTALIETANTGKFGKDFAASINFVKDKGNLANMAMRDGASIRQWVQGTLADVGKTVGDIEKLHSVPGSPLYGKKFDAQKETQDALNAKQRNYEAQTIVDMRTADDSNPYKLAYTAIAKIPELANNLLAIFINTYGPNGKDPYFQKVDEQFLLQRFASSVANGTMPMPAASKAITEFYKTATQRQATLTHWPLFGMATPEKTYQVKIPRSGLFTSGLNENPGGSIDMGNVADVENYLTKNVAQLALNKQTVAAPTGTMPVADPFGLSATIPNTKVPQ